MANITLPGGSKVHVGNAPDSITVYGNGTVIAGGGSDSISVDSNGFITVGSGNDQLHLWGTGKIVEIGDGHDTIYLGHGHDTVTEQGTGVVHTKTGSATVIGGTFDFNYLPGKQGAPGVSEYIAENGRQTLLGAHGDTEFVGGKGKTSMVGGHGNDTFIGGSGHDTMVGGTEHNLFEFLKSDAGGQHVISNFVSGQDQLYLEGETLSYLNAHHDITTSGGNTYISLDHGKTTVELKGITGLDSSDITTHKH